jgi:hypothetical protein
LKLQRARDVDERAETGSAGKMAGRVVLDVHVSYVAYLYGDADGATLLDSALYTMPSSNHPAWDLVLVGPQTEDPKDRLVLLMQTTISTFKEHEGSTGVC